MTNTQSTFSKVSENTVFVIAPLAMLSLILMAACAHQLERPVVQLMAGIRVVEGCSGDIDHPTPECNCKQPPKIYEGAAKRFDESCMYVEGMQAGCTYITRVDRGRSWACGIGFEQASCSSDWKPVTMQCSPWDDRYSALIPHYWDTDNEGLQGTGPADDSKTDDDPKHPLP